nr:hypothetical protein CFP56_34868 [Quercus suber]
MREARTLVDARCPISTVSIHHRNNVSEVTGAGRYRSSWHKLPMAQPKLAAFIDMPDADTCRGDIDERLHMHFAALDEKRAQPTRSCHEDRFLQANARQNARECLRPRTRPPSGNGATAMTTSNLTAKGALEELIKSATTVAQDESLSWTLQHFDQLPKLEAQLKLKDEQIEKLALQLQQEQIKYQNVQQAALSTYEVSKDKLKLQLDNAGKTVRELTEEVKSKTSAHEEVKNQQSTLQNAVKGLRETLTSHEANLAKSEGLKSALQKAVESLKTKNDSLQKNLNTHEGRHRRMEADLKRKEDEAGSLSKEFNFVKRQFAELQSCFLPLDNHDPEPVLQKLATPWNAICKLVCSKFSVDFPNDIFQDKAWHRLEQPRRFKNPLPLPQSNSLAAKQMRSVAVVAIVVRAIDFHIFQPTYLLSPSSDLRGLTIRQAEQEPRKKAMLRAFFQAMLPQDQATAATRQVARMCDETMEDINGLLPTSMIPSFKEQLREIVEDICDIWQQVLRLEPVVEPTFVLQHYSDWLWEKLRFDTEQVTIDEGARVPNDAQAEAQLVVFPRFCIVDEEGLDPVTHGVVILRSQTESAAQEVEQLSFGSGPERRDSLLSKLSRPRRASTLNKSIDSAAGPQGFLEPASPGKLPNGRK